MVDVYSEKSSILIWKMADGFTMGKSDNCVFYKKDCVICVYDFLVAFLVAGASDREVKHVKEVLDPFLESNSTSITIDLRPLININILRRSLRTSA
jgi:hypothetical protein